MNNFSKKTLFHLSLFSFLFILIALLLFLEKPSGSIRGVIQTTDGKPIPKANISADAYPIVKKVRSSTDGNFQFDLVPIGKYYINITAKGFEGVYLSNKIIEEGKITDLGKIRLKEKDPNLFVSLWSQTKTADEKINLSISGNKVRDIQLTVYKFDLVEFLKNGGNFDDLSKEDLDLKSIPKLEKVKEWEEKISDEDLLEFSKVISAHLDNTGLYLIHSFASSLDRKFNFSGNLLVNKTDLGFVVKRDESTLLVYLSSFKNLKSVTDAEVHLIDANGKMISPATYSQGIAKFNLPTSKDWATPEMIVATEKGNVAYVFAPDQNAIFGEEEESDTADPASNLQFQKPELFLYTERPIYRPAQTVYFKGITRNKNSVGKFDLSSDPQTVQVSVEDPKSNILYETELKTNSYGSFWGEFQLDEEAEVGFYNIVATINGKTFKKDFQVDEYRKPEFKVEIKPDKNAYFSGDKINFLVDVQYYFGAPVESEVDYTVYKSKSDFSLPGDEQFSYLFYDDTSIDGYGEVVSEGKGKTDSTGHLKVEAQTTSSEQDKRYTLRVTAKDITDRIVEAEESASVRAGDFFFRTKRTEFLATPKKAFPLTVISRDYNGKPVEKEYQVQLEREKWDPIAHEQTYEKTKTVKGNTDSNGEGKTEIVFDRGGYYRLAISGKDSNHRKVLFYDYLWVSGNAADSEDFGLQKNLEIITDKKKYEANEKVKVFIVGPVKNGTVLLTIEGSKIHDYQLIQLDGFSKEIELSLKKEWIPNIFISASAIGLKEYYEGFSEIQISPKENFLNIEIQPSGEKFHPADTIHYKLLTKNNLGNPVSAEVSLGVVDESIYALRKDTTDIKDFFWGPKPNQVRSTFSFSGYYTGGVSKEDQNLLRRNFKDTAFWNPSILTNEQGEAEISFQLPDNLTTWRATVVGETLTTEVGQQLNKILSSKEIIARIASPRFFRERDRIVLKALIHNYTDQEQTLNVDLSVQGIQLSQSSAGETRKITIPPQKVSSFDFEIIAKQSGKAKIQLLAKNEKVSDGVELTIPVLPHGIEEHQYAQGEMIAGAVENPSSAQISLQVPSQINPNATRLKVTLDTTFIAQLLGSLSYLVDYPYGCVEQTMSRFLPALMVSKLYESLHLTDPMVEKKLPKVIEKSIKRLVKMQHADGGWGWWKNDSTSPFMTSYALYGLYQAKENGEKIDSAVLENGKKSLQEQMKKGFVFASSWEKKDLPFIHYVASLLRIKGISISSDLSSQTILQQAFQVLTLTADKKMTIAHPILLSLEKRAVCEQLLCHFQEDPKIDQYSDSVEVTAWALQALVAGGSENKVLEESVVKWLLSKRQGGMWQQTRATAVVLYSLIEYSKTSTPIVAGVNSKLLLNSNELEKVNVASSHFVRNWNPISIHPEKNILGIENLTSSSLFYQTDLTYFTQEESLAASSNGIEVKREYFILKSEEKKSDDGKKLYKPTPLKVKIQKGDLIGVRLTITSNEDLSYLMIEDSLPSGFEVIQDLQFDAETSYLSELNIRDEKITLFSTILKKGKNVFNYVIRPELSGSFHVMPASSYEMYQPMTRGVSAESMLEVQ